MQPHHPVLKRRDPLAQTEWDVGAGHSGARVPNGTSHHGLHQGQDQRSAGPASENPSGGLPWRDSRVPPRGRHYRQSRDQHQEDQGQSQMGRGHEGGQTPQDRDSAKDGLHQEERDAEKGGGPNPRKPRFLLPGQVCGSGEEEDEASGHQSVKVLPEDSPRHFREPAPETRRPVGAGQAGLRGVDHAPQKDEPDGPDHRDGESPVMLRVAHNRPDTPVAVDWILWFR
jgi:hypothetical protein